MCDLSCNELRPLYLLLSYPLTPCDLLRLHTASRTMATSRAISPHAPSGEARALLSELVQCRTVEAARAVLANKPRDLSVARLLKALGNHRAGLAACRWTFEWAVEREKGAGGWGGAPLGVEEYASYISALRAHRRPDEALQVLERMRAAGVRAAAASFPPHRPSL